MSVNLSFERTSALLKRRAVGKSKHHQDVKDGRWVRPIHDGKAALYPVHEDDQLLAAIAAGSTEIQRRALVEQLHLARQKLPELAGRAV